MSLTSIFVIHGEFEAMKIAHRVACYIGVKSSRWAPSDKLRRNPLTSASGHEFLGGSLYASEAGIKGVDPQGPAAAAPTSSSAQSGADRWFGDEKRRLIRFTEPACLLPKFMLAIRSVAPSHHYRPCGVDHSSSLNSASIGICIFQVVSARSAPMCSAFSSLIMVYEPKE